MATPGAAEQPTPAAGRYELDPAASTVRFTTRAVFGLLPVRATFPVSRGRITVADDGEPSVDAVIDATGFDSGNRQRDEHVRSSDYLDAARSPEIVFRSRTVERTARDGAVVTGDLTVRGATAPVRVTVSGASGDGRRLTARGTATVDRYAHGITTARGMTGRYLRITLDVAADA